MFGEKADNHITMLQRLVALVRDLVLAVVAGLTAVIVAYGGDPTMLNSLDWTRLVGAAFLVVLGPVAAFFIVKLLFNLLYGFLVPLGSMILPDAPMPRGLFAWLLLRVLRMPRRDYVSAVRRSKQHSAAFAATHPRAWAVIRRVMVFRYHSFQNASNPYLFAIIALIVAALVFRTTLARYVP
jgi:hypothetical protein